MARRRMLTDEDIVARARPVFVERGYAARTRQIAAAVGLTWGAIALRFGSKRALFTQAMAAPVHGPDGAIRSDISPEALARVVLALLTGDVAQRFMARERTLTADPAFVDGVVRLLSAR